MQKNQALGRRVYEPTCEDIERACNEIQATWSPRARAKRARPPSARVVGPADHTALHARRGDRGVGL